MVDKARNRKHRKIKRTTSIVDPHEISNIQYNEVSGAEKNLHVGPRLIPKGAVGVTATSFGAANGKVIEIYNNTGATLFFISGDSSVLAPTDPTNGVAVPANSYRAYAMGGDDTHLRASGVGLFIYEIDDESLLTPRNPAN